MNINQSERILGIDIGGTTAKYAIVTSDGEMTNKGSFCTGLNVDKEQFLSSLFSVVDEAVTKNINGIGICSLGIVNAHTGEIVGGVENMPYLEGINLKEVLSEHYAGIPIHVSNDVKAAARGEQWMGAAKNCRNFFCITLGTGLGGALVIESQVVEGAHHHAGEIGYYDYVDENNYFEKQVSTKHVMDVAAEKMNLPHINGVEFFEKVSEGNSDCTLVLEQWLEKISRIIANLIIILDLEKVIIGGGVSGQKEILIPNITRKVNRMLPPKFRNQTKVEVALCENDAGILGAVSVFMR